MMRRVVMTGLAMFLGAVGMMTMPGCYTPDGGFWPRTGAAQTYYSTERQAKVVTIVDTRTNEAVFTAEIPIGHQLTLDFVSNRGDDPVMSPDLMRYAIWPKGKTTGTLRNSQSVPSADSRMIVVDLVDGPGYSTAPPTARYRVDSPQSRPAWWSEEGGRMPDTINADPYDD
ncbi:MAG: hypothetical protein KDA25_04490 [Phycisphaerales bacterium]|nr:hypothetical protein [Phycisphaerales bacterium]